LHPVANPAIDRDDGTIYVTLSGSRGQKVPTSIFKIGPDDAVTPFISEDIVNPTGMAFNREGTLYVTSRYDGTLYRISHFKEVQTVATDLGVATGVVFDRRGDIFVGDRSGTVFRVNEIGEARPFASLEPSVSAYHMAFGPDGDLYVAGPTVSSFESILRLNSMGDATIFYRGLGRPQGLAFDAQGNLYTAASHFAGRRAGRSGRRRLGAGRSGVRRCRQSDRRQHPMRLSRADGDQGLFGILIILCSIRPPTHRNPLSNRRNKRFAAFCAT
jgi:sugar lactone lactonase YvrE